MEIEFLKNGIELIYSSNHRKYIAYQAISQITGVSIHQNYKNYDILADRFFGDYVEKYCSFTIITNNKKEFEIYLKSSIKKFRRLSGEYKKLSWWKKFFFFSEDGMDKEAQEWMNNLPLDMFDSVSELKMFREKVIEKFDEWNTFLKK